MSQNRIPSRLLLSLCLLIICLVCGQRSATANEPVLQGPGLGNLTYSAEELFKPTAIIGEFPRSPSGIPYGINVAAMNNGYLVAVFAPDHGLGPGGLDFYDVSDPRQPVLVHRIYDPEGVTADFRETHAIGFTYFNGGQYMIFHTCCGFEIWDIQDALNPVRMSKAVLPELNFGGYNNTAWQLFVQAPYVYVAGANLGLYVVDISDPTTPVLVNQIPISQLGGFPIGPIFAFGNRLVVSSMAFTTNGFSVLDISDPRQPTLTTTQPRVPKYYASCYDGNSVYLANSGSNARMVTYDVLDDYITFVDNDSVTISSMLYCNTQDEYMFQGTKHEVVKVNIADPDNYHIVGWGKLGVRNSDHGQVAPMGNLVFIGNDHGTGSGLLVHQLAPDHSPPWVVAVNPTDNSIGQSLCSRVGVSFSDAVELLTVNNETFMVRPIDGEAVDGMYSAHSGLVNFAPSHPFQPNTTYEIVIPAGGITDWMGNAIDTTLTARFTTGAICTPNTGVTTSFTSTAVAQHSGHCLSGNRTDHAEDAPMVQGRCMGVANQSFVFQPAPSDTMANVYHIIAEHSGHCLSVSEADTADETPLVQSMCHGAAHQRFQLHAVPDVGDNVFELRAVHSDKCVSTENSAMSNSSRIVQQSCHGADYQHWLVDGFVALSPVAPPLTVSITAPRTHTVDSQVHLTAEVVGTTGEVNVSWDFGDGTVTSFANDFSRVHTYAEPGHYQIIVTVQDGVHATNASLLLTIHHARTPQQPRRSHSILSIGDTVYTVNQDNDSITSIDTTTLSKQWEAPTGAQPRTLAQAPNGDLWVTNELADTVTVHTPTTGAIVTTIALPYGSRPFGVVFSPDGAVAYVTLAAAGTLVQLDPAGAVIATVDVGPTPRGLAISSDATRVLVTRFLSSEGGGEIVEVDAATLSVQRRFTIAPDTTTVDAEERGRGLANYLSSVTITPDGRAAWVPAKKDNIFRGLARDGQPLTFESTVRAMTAELDLLGNGEREESRIDYNDRALPVAVTFTPLGDYAFVGLQGSNVIEVRDRYSGERVTSIEPTGLAPKDLVLNADGSRLYVHNFLSRTVTVYDVQGIRDSIDFRHAQLATVATVSSERLAPDVLHGKQLFYNAVDARMSRDGYLSCAVCHVDGGHDGRVWDFTDRGEGLRNTLTLNGRGGLQHGPVHWTGNFDEIHDFENDIRLHFGGGGFMSDAAFNAGTRRDPLGDPKAGTSRDLDALVAYVSSLREIPVSPYRHQDGSLTIEAVAGQAIFASLNCGTCHSGQAFTDSQLNLFHDVGTVKPTSGSRLSQPLSGFDTPTLQGLWATAPYLHDGAAPTLYDVINNPLHGNASALSQADKAQLVAYLLQIDNSVGNEPLRLGNISD